MATPLEFVTTPDIVPATIATLKLTPVALPPLMITD
jgi:hypothetical protein